MTLGPTPPRHQAPPDSPFLKTFLDAKRGRKKARWLAGCSGGGVKGLLADHRGFVLGDLLQSEPFRLGVEAVVQRSHGVDLFLLVASPQVLGMTATVTQIVFAVLFQPAQQIVFKFVVAELGFDDFVDGVHVFYLLSVAGAALLT